MDTDTERDTYPSDISDEEWSFVAPYLTLMRDDAPQRDHDLREVFNGLRWIVRSGAPWRYLPTNLPPWHTVYQQTQRWIRAGVFEAIVADLRVLIRLGEGKASSRPPPSSTVARCKARSRMGTEASMTGTRNARDRRCIWRWTPWGSSWRWW